MKTEGVRCGSCQAAAVCFGAYEGGEEDYACGECCGLGKQFIALREQVGKLGDFIMANVPGEPSENEGAVDCAIRIITQLREQLKEAQEFNSTHNRNMWFEECQDLREQLAELGEWVKACGASDLEVLELRDQLAAKDREVARLKVIVKIAKRVRDNHFADDSVEEVRKYCSENKIDAAMSLLHDALAALDQAELAPK